MQSDRVWSVLCFPASGDGDLAWEFTQHLIYAYVTPVGGARANQELDIFSAWGNRSLATPILRSLFESHALNTFTVMHRTWNEVMQDFTGMNYIEERRLQFENAIQRIAAYNEQPMRRTRADIPARIIFNHFDDFRMGTIDAQTASHRMHNAVSLWLIE